jgi:hypothetical protein
MPMPRRFPTTDIDQPRLLLVTFIRIAPSKSASARFLASLVLATTAAAAAAAPVTQLAGRGVFALDAAAACPFGPPATGAAACGRIALDDTDTHATLDADSHVIHFANARSYHSKTVVGDVLMQGSGRSASGQRVPLNFHVVLRKSGGKWSINSHAHAPVHGNFTDVQVDAWRIEAGDAGAGGIVVTPATIRETLAKPGVMARVANEFVEVTDNRSVTATDPDITIGLGLGRAAFSVMRARLHADAVVGGDLGAVLKAGTWSLELKALSSKIPKDVVRREMFLFGMDTQAQLKPLLEHGFAAGDSLVVGAVDGRGYLRLGDQQADFPAAAQTGLAFMQQSFIGLVLGWEQSNPAPAGH